MLNLLKNESLVGFEFRRFSWESRSISAQATMSVLRPLAAKDINGTIYFMHAGDSDDQQLVSGQFIERFPTGLLQQLADFGFQIVCPGIGASFLSGGYRGLFWDEVVPHAEKETNTRFETRLMTGVSMGGFAALSAFLSQPDSFRALGTLAPAVFDCDLFSADSVAAYVLRSGALAPYLEFLCGGVQSAFGTREHYLERDPLSLARKLTIGALSGHWAYLATGAKDEFGLALGTQQIAESLRDAGAQVSCQIVEDAHHNVEFATAQLPELFSSLMRIYS